jgi:hypothetical protein
MMKILTLIFIILNFILSIIFILKNDYQRATFNLLLAITLFLLLPNL